jgi:hypothetical protein
MHPCLYYYVRRVYRTQFVEEDHDPVTLTVSTAGFRWLPRSLVDKRNSFVVSKALLTVIIEVQTFLEGGGVVTMDEWMQYVFKARQRTCIDESELVEEEVRTGHRGLEPV